MTQNLFIALEGIDGSGKSTQTKLLAAKLEAAGHKVHITFEPTDSPIGKIIRDIFNHRMEADHRTIAALFAADRLHHLLNKEDGILKMLPAFVIEPFGVTYEYTEKFEKLKYVRWYDASNIISGWGHLANNLGVIGMLLFNLLFGAAMVISARKNFFALAAVLAAFIVGCRNAALYPVEDYFFEPSGLAEFLLFAACFYYSKIDYAVADSLAETELAESAVTETAVTESPVPGAVAGRLAVPGTRATRAEAPPTAVEQRGRG